MTAKIKIRQCVIFNEPREFDTEIIKCLTVENRKKKKTLYFRIEIAYGPKIIMLQKNTYMGHFALQLSEVLAIRWAY